ncbi:MULTISPECIES: hypothetical protein [unclassified Paenibacillus]|uniref:hypothetical protein n=1 Tax=unclassified Paenibacillus TaxID=185978 RepID=UPI0015A1B743|nr:MULTISPECIES: hypothetical protein [unclassified Paenibacillus]
MRCKPRVDIPIGRRPRVVHRIFNGQGTSAGVNRGGGSGGRASSLIRLARYGTNK